MAEFRKPPPLGIAGTAILFGFAAVLLYAATHWLIPFLGSRTHWEPVLLWFLAGGLGVFLPLLLCGGILLRLEGTARQPDWWPDRLWFRPMTAADWLTAAAGTLGVIVCGAVTMIVLRLVFGEVKLHPSFLKMEPLTPDRYWILAVWLPFWLVNIFGEEILWRGIVLPRQESAFGRWAWVANGGGWLLFHLAFGPIILLTLWPMTFLLPYLVQRNRNAWIGVVMHAAVNGPGFIAVAFGLV